MSRRCHICERPREPEDQHYEVALRNGIYFPACCACWLKWPDEHKRFPPVGYGRWQPDVDRRSTVSLDDFELWVTVP
jgi:hypothetical protein